jgi:hypothetical protein
VASFAGSSSTTKGTTTASSFSVTGTLIDVSARLQWRCACLGFAEV